MTTNHESPLSAPLFARRLPLIQMVISEREGIRNRAYSATTPALAHYHSIMLLAAGIAGLVAPILSTQGGSLINSWFLKRAAICMGLTIVAGVITQAYLRYASAYFVYQIERKFQSEFGAMGQADSEEAILNALADVTQLHAGKLERAEHRLSLMIWFDIVFYLLFVWGIVYLIRGFIQR